MELLYPAGPESVPASLTKPTTAYRQRAWLATAGLLSFVVLYFALAGWFGWTSYKLISGALAGGQETVWVWLGGLCAAFLAVFMLKALFFVERGGQPEDIEITAAEEPRLFAFLCQLADEAGAPRPHRVFVSPRVNAAVFYDLSIFNLLFPSKKNLEIGLGLVNVLTLGELKAVLAHEFGHFAQRSMAVGRWVYIAQQIAAHIIAKRDVLDDFLRGLSHFDLRLAWIGWVLSLVVWSIRSLLETAFNLVVLAQRALSREMEMQADLVAVSLTGSDALIHALHRIQAADEAWDRTLGFANGELAKGRVPRDLFAVQSRVIERMRAILDNPAYGALPVVPEGPPETRRVFKAELAAPPRMWLTHPLNHEREDNAKRVYIAAPRDERSAWELFSDPAALRERVTAHLAPPSAKQATMVPVEETLQTVDEQFRREYLDRRYRGAYLGRSSVRHAATVAGLYAEPQGDLRAALAALYPESLADDIERLRNLEREKSLLEALRDGVFAAPGGVIRHRGREVPKRELPRAIEELSAELAALRTQVCEHDRLCRGTYRAAARALGPGWDAYLDGLVRVLHYADHTDANLRDAQGALGNILRIATATRKVSKADLARIMAAANDLYNVLHQAHSEAGAVQLDAALAARLGVPAWSASLEEFKLSRPAEDRINEWLKVIDGWVDSLSGALSGLERTALEELLVSEARVARRLLDGSPAGEAPAPSGVPAGYAVLAPGQERKRQTQLDWWARFQTANGVLPALARFVVAAGIVGGVLGLGGTLGEARVTVYNGLARDVRVDLGGAVATLRPFGSARLEVPAQGRHTVEARTTDGKLIESFEQEFERSFVARVYNVAGASPLIEWTAVYGNAGERPPRYLGATRWISTNAEYLFEDPPKQIRTKGGGGSREVLSSGGGDRAPGLILDLVKGEAEQIRIATVHARWDAPGSAYVMDWLELASHSPGFAGLVAARLADNPRELISLRLEQDMAGANRGAVCERHRSLAAGAAKDGDLQYLATRCIEDRVAREQAFLKGRETWPDNPWFGYAAGRVYSEQGRMAEAAASLEVARAKQPALMPVASVELARIRRLGAAGGAVNLSDLASGSAPLRTLLALETGRGIDSKPLLGYAELAQGRVANAVQMVKGAESEARLLRLAGASDGADAQLVARALALPVESGLDESTLWASVGLALRQHGDPAPYLKPLQAGADRDLDAMLRVVQLLREGAAPAAVEKAMAGLPVHLRGQACVLGSVALGRSAPRAWRDNAKRALFASERPYFS